MNRKADVDAPYTLRHIEDMLALSRGVITGLIQAGYVEPARGPRNEYRFSFQDVVLLRTAYQLRAARIPARRMLRSLRQLRERLPDRLPLSGLRIKAIGNEVAVRAADAHWEADSGQLLMDFEVAGSPGAITFMAPRAAPAPVVAQRGARSPKARSEPSAAEWFARGERLEGSDAAAAEAAYRTALALAPDLADASVNLGAMLCEAGRCAEAVELYTRAIELSPGVALLYFNQALALEDQQRDAEALRSYQRCLQLDPALADAHYNAARLHEKLGQAQSALRHYSAYRRLKQ